MTVHHEFQDDIDAVNRSKTIPTLLETVMLATGMGFVAVARVTKAHWVACRVVDSISFGLQPGDELDVEATLCRDVRQTDQEIVIDDVQADPVYADHPCPKRYGFRSYVSVPIHLADGSFFGTLCAFDPAPRRLNEDHILAMLRLFARLIGEALDSDEALNTSATALNHERDLTEVQERFIAILAHDLRNPVNALTAGLRMIERQQIDGKAAQLVALMRASVNRMGLLIENLLDQARNRSGGGIVIERGMTDTLPAALTQIIGELQAVATDKPIVADLDIATPIYCDVPRVSQLFSNLLANAITHGAENEPIRVTARAADGVFSLAVANGGVPIADQMLPTLFLPFERGQDRPSREGLGLGLFIASEIAKGHDGTLQVTSDATETVFTFRMPVDADRA